ncbi:hypothetical protein BO83DRAFT_373962 [Aspergillus eucalypticola CBS 122712]|uniref:Uncharacterized protein n=1 Tax=Aspergillus eucalypticola (strain CBS 122712 / IBT 29274) TaxID=1448314 RepID=A0A317WHU2_ASPEC|nr:uncharacterized protein BO83DRAFT_373962 [Aspergillus eucalypticola CBS 122712]PWY85221.1 hypothetical protein BO83DRAFT_373962 [Aspergillus eucalypticola CBS 122712]
MGMERIRKTFILPITWPSITFLDGFEAQLLTVWKPCPRWRFSSMSSLFNDRLMGLILMGFYWHYYSFSMCCPFYTKANT